MLRPGTISPDKWNPASRICSDTGTDYFKAKYILEYIGAVPGVLVWCCMMLAAVVRVRVHAVKMRQVQPENCSMQRSDLQCCSAADSKSGVQHIS